MITEILRRQDVAEHYQTQLKSKLEGFHSKTIKVHLFIDAKIKFLPVSCLETFKKNSCTCWWSKRISILLLSKP